MTIISTKYNHHHTYQSIHRDTDIIMEAQLSSIALIDDAKKRTDTYQEAIQSVVKSGDMDSIKAFIDHSKYPMHCTQKMLLE